MQPFLITSHLHSSFRAIGARVRAVPTFVRRERWPVRGAVPQRIRVTDDLFELALSPGAQVAVLDFHRADRHLVLNLQDTRSAPERFLCGFDERHWFVAAVTGQTVASAKDSLMPAEVRAAAQRAGVRHADMHRRHTRAFIRQGEWFFVPTEQNVGPLAIHRHEPLIRPGGGKPHMVDELVRTGGEMVWFHAQHGASGLSDREREALPASIRTGSGWFRRMRIGTAGRVLVRGAVRHPDHATVYLRTWHAVYINTEVRPASLGFLD